MDQQVQKLSNISVGNSPVGIAVNPSSNWIYVANINSGTVSVMDGITNKVTDTITVGKAPYGVAVNPVTNKVYVTNIQSNSISVIDGKTNKVTGTYNSRYKSSRSIYQYTYQYDICDQSCF